MNGYSQSGHEDTLLGGTELAGRKRYVAVLWFILETNRYSASIGRHWTLALKGASRLLWSFVILSQLLSSSPFSSLRVPFLCFGHSCYHTSSISPSSPQQLLLVNSKAVAFFYDLFLSGGHTHLTFRPVFTVRRISRQLRNISLAITPMALFRMVPSPRLEQKLWGFQGCFQASQIHF